MFLDLPLGHTTGAPNEVDTQRQILRAGLEAGAAMTEPGTIVDLPWRWRDDDWKAEPLSWSRRRQSAGPSPARSGGDTRTERTDQPRYQTDDDRAAAEARSLDEQCLACLGIPTTD